MENVIPVIFIVISFVNVTVLLLLLLLLNQAPNV